jgi:hypothetical protein
MYLVIVSLAPFGFHKVISKVKGVSSEDLHSASTSLASPFHFAIHLMEAKGCKRHNDKLYK